MTIQIKNNKIYFDNNDKYYINDSGGFGSYTMNDIFKELYADEMSNLLQYQPNPFLKSIKKEPKK